MSSKKRERREKESRDPWGVRLARVAIRQPNAIVALMLVGATILLACWISKWKTTPAKNNDAIVETLDGAFYRDEIFFAAFGSEDVSQEKVRDALEQIADQAEERLAPCELIPWGPDAESMKKSRLYLLTNDELDFLAEELALAQELAAKRWETLRADAFLERFEDRMRSEETEARRVAIADALPFVRALAETTATNMQKRAQTASARPIAFSAFDRAKCVDDARFFFSKERNAGVVGVCALKSGGPRDRTRFAQMARNILNDARKAFPELTFELDDARVESVSTAKSSKDRRLFFALAPACLAMWLALALVFGSRKRALTVGLCAAIATLYASLAIVPFARNAFDAFVATLALFGVSCALAAGYGLKYASIRTKERSTSEALLLTSDFSNRAFLSAFAVALSSFVVAFCAGRDFRVLAFSLAFGAPIVAFCVALFLPAATRASEGDKPFQTFPTPLQLRSTNARRRKTLTTLALVVAVFLAIGATRARMSEPTIQTVGARVAELCGRRALYAAFHPFTEEKANLLRAYCNEEPELRVDSIDKLVARVSPEKARRVERIEKLLMQTPLELGEPSLAPQSAVIDALFRLIDAANNSECACVDESARQELVRWLTRAEANVENMTDSDYRARVGAFTSWTCVETLKKLFELRAVASAEIPSVDALSERVRARYDALDKDRPPIIYVYSTDDLSDPTALRAFVDNVNAIDPIAYGPAIDARLRVKYETQKPTICALLWFGTLGLTGAFFARSFLVGAGVALQAAFCALCPLGLAGVARCVLDARNLWVLPVVSIVAYVVATTADDSDDAQTRADAAALVVAILLAGAAFGVALAGYELGQEIYDAAKGLAIAACAWIALRVCVIEPAQ